MQRIIDLALNKFSTLPPTITDSKTGSALTRLPVGVKQVFHHYFLAKYGDAISDPGVYEYEQGLTDGPDWRFRGDGIGVDKEAKRNVSNELAKGFARWFLYEHVGLTYFSPLEHLVDEVNADGSCWKRAASGDLPDYVCGQNSSDVNLLETKGRYEAVDFGGKKFAEFRAQVQRARLLDGNGRAIQVKGFVSVARWATEAKPRIRARLLVEDPLTAGEPPGREGFPRQVGRAMVLGHYTVVFQRLQLPLHADAIRFGWTLEGPTGARRGVWECIAGPLKGRRFVGGVLSRNSDVACSLSALLLGALAPTHVWDFLRVSSPFVLSAGSHFFGLEEHVMRQLIKAIRLDRRELPDIEHAQVPERTVLSAFYVTGLCWVPRGTSNLLGS